MSSVEPEGEETMVGSEQDSTALGKGTGGVLGWIRRLVAGAEIEALEARIARLARDADATQSRSAATTEAIAELKKQVDARDQELTKSKRAVLQKESECRDLTGKLAEARGAAEALEKKSLERDRKAGDARAGDTKPDDPRLSRRISELEGMLSTATRARDAERASREDLERRLSETSGKLVKAQASLEALHKAQREQESKISAAEARAKATEQKAARKLAELEERARESGGALAAASDSATILELRVAELQGTLDGMTRDRQTERASRDDRIADLERRLVDALALPREPTALEIMLAEQEALVEELERALVAQRTALEQRDARLAALAPDGALGGAPSQG